MREKMIERQIRIFNIVLIVMILLMMTVFLYAKDGLHADEIMSYESANAYGMVGTLYESLSSSENIWVTKAEVYDSVTVGDDDYWNFSTAMRYSYADFNPPLYRILLHMFCSATPGELSKWSGGVLNLCFLFGLLFLIVRMCQDVMGHPKIAPYCLAIYGFSLGSITGVLIVKPYMMIAFCLFWLLYEHGLFWVQSEKKNYIRLSASMLVASLTQFYLIAFMLVLVVCYILFLLRMKRGREIRAYLLAVAVPAVIGFAAITTIDLVFNSDNTAGNELWNKLASMDFRITPMEFVTLYLENTFGNVYVGIFLVVIFLVIGIACLITRKLVWRHGMLYMPALMLIPTAVYIFFPTKAAACYSDRFLISTFPILLILMIWGISKMLRILPLKDIVRQWIMSIAICILIMPGIVFSDYEYLMQDAKEKEEIARTYEDFPCVFVGDEIYENIPEMMHFSETLTTTPELYKTIVNDSHLKEADGIVLMVKKDMQDFEIIDFLQKTYHFDMMDVLSEAKDGTRYYFLSRE